MSDPVLISIGGGKGGIGKSTLTSNIGTSLAQKGYRVIFVDADMSGANLHLHLGVRRPEVGLMHFLSDKKKHLSEVLLDTIVPNTKLLSGASDILDIANPQYAQKQKLIKNLSKLDADFILIDLGAGSSANVTDFFSSYSNGIIVSDGLPASIENAYAFLKNGMVRGLIRLFPGRKDIKEEINSFFSSHATHMHSTINDLLKDMSGKYPIETETMKKWLISRKTFFILNMARENRDFDVVKKFPEIIKKYLNVTIHYIGYLIQDDEIRKSNRDLKPFYLLQTGSNAESCIDSITENIIKLLRQ